MVLSDANQTKSYVLSEGTIANTNFVAIAANSPNKAAAMVVGNYIGKIEAAFTRTPPLYCNKKIAQVLVMVEDLASLLVQL